FSAWATTCNRTSREMTFANPSRKIGWSSAIRMRISRLCLSVILRRSFRVFVGVGQERLDGRPLFGRGVNGQRAPQQPHSLGHAAKAESRVAGTENLRRFRRLWVETLTVVSDGQPDARAFALERNARFGGA